MNEQQAEPDYGACNFNVGMALRHLWRSKQPQADCVAELRQALEFVQRELARLNEPAAQPQLSWAPGQFYRTADGAIGSCAGVDAQGSRVAIVQFPRVGAYWYHLDGRCTGRDPQWRIVAGPFASALAARAPQLMPWTRDKFYRTADGRVGQLLDETPYNGKLLIMQFQRRTCWYHPDGTAAGGGPQDALVAGPFDSAEDAAQPS